MKENAHEQRTNNPRTFEVAYRHHAPSSLPLLFSTFFRFINLSLDMVLFAWAAWTVVQALAGEAIGFHLGGIVVVAVVKALAYYCEQF